LVKKYNLKDDKLIDRNFVRLEAHPKNDLTSTNPDDWNIIVDEQSTLPAWFEEKSIDWLEKCRRKMVKFVVPGWIKKGVGGSLDLRGTKVTSLGKTKVMGQIYSDVKLTG
jgi:hypothetical protein